MDSTERSHVPCQELCLKCALKQKTALRCSPAEERGTEARQLLPGVGYGHPHRTMCLANILDPGAFSPHTGLVSRGHCNSSGSSGQGVSCWILILVCLTYATNMDPFCASFPNISSGKIIFAVYFSLPLWINPHIQRAFLAHCRAPRCSSLIPSFP